MRIRKKERKVWLKEERRKVRNIEIMGGNIELKKEEILKCSKERNKGRDERENK